jgi:hypothetical protein
MKVGVHAWEVSEHNGLETMTNKVINALASPPRGIPRGLFIGAVRGSSNNVQTTP